MARNTLYINAENMRHNYNLIKEKVGKDVVICPVVKANAYGVGLKEVTSVLNAQIYAVGNVEEAINLKKINKKTRILIVYPSLIEDIKEIVDNDFMPNVSNMDFINKLNSYAKTVNKKVKINLEIDTGMSRFGINPKEAIKYVKKIKELDHIELEGVSTHYSSVNSLDKDSVNCTKKQTEMFKSTLSEIKKIVGSVKYIHAASGSGIFNPESEIFNMVRPGYILYGYYGCKELKKVIELKPTLRLATKIIQISEYKKGTSVGYFCTFRSKRKTKIAVVGIGYSEGLFRCLSNKGYLLVNNQRAPIIGNICMDVTMIDITDIKGNINVGDEVLVFDNKNITLDEIVELVGTSGYEFLARLSPKIKKVIE